MFYTVSASKKLSDLIRRPFDLYRAGAIDEYLMGLMNQVAQAMDDSITQEVTNNLIKKPGQGFGFDLVSFNIQRGRDFGLPGYMEYRRYCGLTVANRFEDMAGFMPNSTIQRYQTIYSLVKIKNNNYLLYSFGLLKKIVKCLVVNHITIRLCVNRTILTIIIFKYFFLIYNY